MTEYFTFGIFTEHQCTAFIISKADLDKVITVDRVGKSEGMDTIMYGRNADDHARGNENHKFWEDKHGIIHSKLTGFVMDTALHSK